MEAYVEQVFPEKVNVCVNPDVTEPKFFSFMSCDYKGFNMYNHVLTVHERISETLVKEDFDRHALIEQLNRRREQKDYLKKILDEIREEKSTTYASSTLTSTGDEDEDQDMAQKGEFGQRHDN